MKIFIIGISGSGKTHLSKKLSKKYNIPAFDLDDIYFSKKYIKKRSPEESEKILNKKMKGLNSWVFEGIYHDWTSKLVEESDIIIWLDLNKNLLSWRIFKRFFKKNKEYSESFWSMLKLLKFQRQYRKIRKGKNISFYEAHKKLLSFHRNKLIKIRSKKDLDNLKI